MKQTKILVTGATGGMAGYIVNDLLARNFDVIVSARNSEKIKETNFFGKVTFIPYDLSSQSQENLFQYFNAPDKVIHLAWDKLKDHKNEAHVGSILKDQKKFLENLITNGLQDLTCVGTCYEYGLREGQLLETDPAAPVIAYGQGKNLLRIFLEELQNRIPYNLKWLRVFNVFSEGKSGGNLYSHLMAAVESGQDTFNMSGGEQIRDYLTATEVSERIVRVAIQQEVTGIINCCSGKPIKLKDLITNFLEKRKINIRLNLGFYPYLSHEPMAHWGSTIKLNKALDQTKAEK